MYNDGHCVVLAPRSVYLHAFPVSLHRQVTITLSATVADPGFLESGRGRRLADGHEGVGCAPPQKKKVLNFAFEIAHFNVF